MRIAKITVLVALAILAVLCAPSLAQQALWGGEEITSPEIHEDGIVTFRLSAPGATEVKISGDWMPAERWVPGSEAMIGEDRGR